MCLSFENFQSIYLNIHTFNDAVLTTFDGLAGRLEIGSNVVGVEKPY